MIEDVVDLFLARAAEGPKHTAIATSEHSISYHGLEGRVRAFAAIFATFSEPRVFIALPPSIDAYASILASGLAGGFHTPVNLASPPEKLQRIVRQLEPNIFVGKTDFVSDLARLSPNAIIVDPSELDPAKQLSGKGSRHRLAYVFFTSGSTGEPKGVMISRQALAHYVRWLSTFEITPADRISQQPNLAFDISMTDIFGAFCYGATLYPLDVEGDRLLPARFIQRHKITVWNSTPSVISLMMRAKQVRASTLSSVRLFNFCGEPLLREHLDALFAAVPRAIVQNTYGPTEATISMTSLAMNATNYRCHCAASVALGDCIPGMDIVLSGGTTPEEGEIVIIGPQLADGYWRDDTKTAAAFRAVSSADPRRGYFTGDGAERRGPDLFFKERLDFQVKVRGHRIELDEVAAAIRGCGYPVACVFKRGEALAAVVEHPGHEAAFDEAALQAALLRKLEPHAVPERILQVARMPRNENDKLDRRSAAALLESALGKSL
jgi:D-alanine--poly(phosphoribitol) ligase subunit 1